MLKSLLDFVVVIHILMDRSIAITHTDSLKKGQANKKLNVDDGYMRITIIKQKKHHNQKEGESGLNLGLLVINVQPGGPADKAGIRETRQVRDRIVLGDIILAVNGVPVETYDDLRNEMERYQIGDEVTFIIQREEEHLEVKIRLEEAE